jgi:hypothetical protein
MRGCLAFFYLQDALSGRALLVFAARRDSMNPLSPAEAGTRA